MRLSPFETFCLYVAIKNHFSIKSYDYFRYGGKTKTNPDNYESRNDKYQFKKLARLYTEPEMLDFMVANFVSDNTSWIGNLLDDSAKDNFLTYRKKKQSITYIYRNELEKATTKAGSIKKLFDINPKQELPPILNLYMQGVVSIETVAILNSQIGLTKIYDTKLTDDFLWPKIRMKMEKIFPFIEFDKEKIKQITKEVLTAAEISAK